MAVGLKHPSAKVHIGDGFKFLADRKNEFDVIITDSSDPEGPAETLFQAPYFKLIHDALKDGGVMTTQGCKPSPYAPMPHKIGLQRCHSLLFLYETNAKGVADYIH